MFSAGTRVYVCCSSITGKKLGPKCHSLGYSSGSNMAYFINYNKEFPIKRQPFVLYPIKIVFTRYGKEEKERCEARDFLQILPVFPESSSKINAGRVEEIIKILKGSELSKNSIWYDIGCNYISDPSNIGTIIPMGCHSPSALAGNEAAAWISSILRHDLFKYLVQTNRHLPTLKSMINNDILAWISNATKSSSARRDLLRWARDSHEHMVTLVESFRRLLATFDKRTYETTCAQSARNFRDGNIDNSQYVTWLVDGLFGQESSFLNKVKLAEKLPLGDKLRNITRNMELVRSVYLTLSPKFI